MPDLKVRYTGKIAEGVSIPQGEKAVVEVGGTVIDTVPTSGFMTFEVTERGLRILTRRGFLVDAALDEGEPEEHKEDADACSD